MQKTAFLLQWRISHLLFKTQATSWVSLGADLYYLEFNFNFLFYKKLLLDFIVNLINFLILQF